MANITQSYKVWSKGRLHFTLPDTVITDLQVSVGTPPVPYGGEFSVSGQLVTLSTEVPFGTEITFTWTNSNESIEDLVTESTDAIIGADSTTSSATQALIASIDGKIDDIYEKTVTYTPGRMELVYSANGQVPSGKVKVGGIQTTVGPLATALCAVYLPVASPALAMIATNQNKLVTMTTTGHSVYDLSTGSTSPGYTATLIASSTAGFNANIIQDGTYMYRFGLANGGSGSQPGDSTVQRCEIGGASSTTLASIPNGLTAAGVSRARNNPIIALKQAGEVYVLGGGITLGQGINTYYGLDATPTKTFNVYNTATNTYSALADFPTGIQSSFGNSTTQGQGTAEGLVLGDGSLIVIGYPGSTQTGVTIGKYNPVTDTWQSVTTTTITHGLLFKGPSDASAFVYTTSAIYTLDTATLTLTLHSNITDLFGSGAIVDYQSRIRGTTLTPILNILLSAGQARRLFYHNMPTVPNTNAQAMLVIDA